MKKAIFVVLEAILFLIVYAAGSLAPGANKLPMWTSILGNRLFIWDGIALMVGVFVLILLVQVARKAIRTQWMVPVIAFALTTLLLAIKGFPLATITIAK